MKKLIYIASILLTIGSIVFIQCDSTDDLVTKNATAGGLVDPTSTSMNYVVGGAGPYTFDLKVYQGEVLTKKVLIYHSFYDKEKDTVSNEVLDTTCIITEAQTHFINSPNFNFARLTNQLMIDGNPLPDSDGKLHIGDKFIFRIVSELENGSQVEQAFRVAYTVSTRYAGTYKAIAAEYYRIGVLTYGLADWAEITIESVDAITYKMVNYVGPSGFPDNTLYFQIDANGSITYPAKWDGKDQVINDVAIITCADRPNDMTNSHCSTSNYVVNDDVHGEDLLHMSFGYYTTGSGPREFYHILKKVVE